MKKWETRKDRMKIKGMFSTMRKWWKIPAEKEQERLAKIEYDRRFTFLTAERRHEEKLMVMAMNARSSLNVEKAIEAVTNMRETRDRQNREIVNKRHDEVLAQQKAAENEKKPDAIPDISPGHARK